MVVSYEDSDKVVRHKFAVTRFGWGNYLGGVSATAGEKEISESWLMRKKRNTSNDEKAWWWWCFGSNNGGRRWGWTIDATQAQALG